ncbi:MAG: 2-oxoacid:acceptor oxidoreductase family protein, partial [Candidatus Limnocylindrales bacterium]
ANPEAIWASLPVDPRREILARRIHLAALDTAALARSSAPRPDLVLRMQGVALVGVFLRLTPFAARAGLGRDELLAAVRPQLEHFFGKRGRRVVEANLALVAAAYDGVIDVTGAVTALVMAPRHEVSLMEVVQ